MEVWWRCDGGLAVLVLTYPPTQQRRMLAPDPQLAPPLFLLYRLSAALAPGSTTEEEKVTWSAGGAAGSQGHSPVQLTC